MQVVVHEGHILEKPESEEEARSFIAGYAASPPSTVGSVRVTNLSTGASCQDVDVATVHFSPIPAATVDELLREGDCMYCAGGLMVEHPLVVPHITRMEGTQDSIMGLSKLLVMRLLLQSVLGTEQL
jgi:septum formation protein